MEVSFDKLVIAAGGDSGEVLQKQLSLFLIFKKLQPKEIIFNKKIQVGRLVGIGEGEGGLAIPIPVEKRFDAENMLVCVEMKVLCERGK